MKNAVAIVSILACLLIVGGAGAVAVKPHECLLLVEKSRRMYQDFQTAQYVAAIIEEKQRELRPVHE